MISFSDPFVQLERYALEKSTSVLSDSDHCEKKSSFGDEVDSLSRQGNEGLTYKEPHTCCFCQKVFSCRDRLCPHIERHHLQAKKWSCDLCPKFYFSKVDIKWHMTRVHDKKQLACKKCDYKTALNSKLDRHKQVHATKVECPICQKLVSSLKSHIKNAHEAKPIVKGSCPICQKVMGKTRIKRHMKTHVHKCGNCDKVFKSRKDLRR